MRMSKIEQTLTSALVNLGDAGQYSLEGECLRLWVTQPGRQVREP
jgi:hypothetical protein